jgi:hypothetical protein
MSRRTAPSRNARGRCYPVKRRFDRLDSIVDHYIKKFRPREEAELDSFRGQPSTQVCIEQAGLARRPDGKRLDHQRRIPAEALRAWANALQRKHTQIHSCRTFDELLNVLEKESRAFWKDGELIVYDTALRIGAYLKIEPEEVFLHRGTREGAKALGFEGSRRSIRGDEFPKAFQRLKPYQIEDCLCIYAEHLKKLGRNN